MNVHLEPSEFLSLDQERHRHGLFLLSFRCAAPLPQFALCYFAFLSSPFPFWPFVHPHTYLITTIPPTRLLFVHPHTHATLHPSRRISRMNTHLMFQYLPPFRFVLPFILHTTKYKKGIITAVRPRVSAKPRHFHDRTLLYLPNSNTPEIQFQVRDH